MLLRQVVACPISDCGALAVAYGPKDKVDNDRENFLRWEFTCPQCWAEFVVPPIELIFQSIPLDWLLAS